MKNNKKLQIASDIFWIVLLSVFAFYVNRDIVIKGLYMDDLYMWSCYGEQSLTEFAFPIGTSTRFRPVYWLATYLQMAIVGNHINWFVPFNIICNIAVAAVLYYIIKKISGFRFLGFLGGVCYLASRFAYYQIGQALGLMETMALLLALLILYLLYGYMNTENDRTAAELVAEGERIRAEEQAAKEAKAKANALFGLLGKSGGASALSAMLSERGLSSEEAGETPKKRLRISLKKCGDWRFFWALLLYFLVVFVHERYLSLLPLFYLVLLVKALRHKKAFRKAYFKENIRLWAAPLLVFAVIFLIRTFCIGTAIPAGTGGTEVTDTFRLSEAVAYAVSQVLYIFGVNAGPEHLCGLPWEQTPVFIKTLTKLSVLALFVICAMFFITLLLNLFSKEKEERAHFFKTLANCFLFTGFIAMCIGCSSVTIRVEMRWIYVSYAAALIFCTYMIREIADTYRAAFAGGAAQPVGCRPPEQPKMRPSETKEASGTGEKHAAGTEAASAAADSADTAAEPHAAGNVFGQAAERMADRILKPSVVTALLALVFTVYTGLSVCTNVFYREYFPKLYFWPDQLRMNSLAEETYEKYGDEIFGKDIYILENTYGMSDFYKDTFFKTFDKEKTAEGTTVWFADSAADIPEEKIASGNILVVKEVPEENGYLDVTKEVLAGTFE